MSLGALIITFSKKNSNLRVLIWEKHSSYFLHRWTSQYIDLPMVVDFKQVKKKLQQTSAFDE